MTSNQRFALATYWSRWGYEKAEKPINFKTLFGRSAPVIMEIGFGMGTSLTAMADSARDKDFLGVEVYQPGVGQCLTALQTRQLTNVRIASVDAIPLLAEAIPDESLTAVLLFFPDPWPKARHHKRRIVNAHFLTLIHSRLADEGYLHIATDWKPYGEYMVELVHETREFIVLTPDDPYYQTVLQRPETRFEARGKALGYNIYELILKKR